MFLITCLRDKGDILNLMLKEKQKNTTKIDCAS